ncbi:MAG: CinA family nicotinamide mononucleotide deamidase-related protein [Candidatus Electronema sp. VV]
MIGEIIAVGDELTTGRIVNTTSAFAARQLFLAGHSIQAMQTIGDAPKLIGEALKRAVGRAEFVLVTGGLGPTSDDLTNEAAAEALERPSTLHPEILERIRAQPWADLSALEKLAWLPQGAEVLNADGRMAGHLLVHEAVPVFFLPGVPSQAEKLLTETVLPRLAGWLGGRRSAVRTRLYKTVGLCECEINQRLLALESDRRVSVGYYPVGGEVQVSLSVAETDEAAAEALFQEADKRLRAALGRHLYGTDKTSLAQALGMLLREKNLTLAAAESCTGGLISAKITAVPGCSAWFAGGVVAYSNHLKECLLGVDAELLRQHGAASGPTAEAMAAGLARRSGSDIAVATTGIAGPDGGTADKPTGTVYIGLWQQGAARACLHCFCGSRHEIQEMTATAALDAVRRELMKTLP